MLFYMHLSGSELGRKFDAFKAVDVSCALENVFLSISLLIVLVAVKSARVNCSVTVVDL